MRILPVLLLFVQLQHLHASVYSPPLLISNPASNKEQIRHKGNMVKQGTELKEKIVSNVNRRAGGGGGGGHGGHAAAARGSHGSSYGHGVGGGDSNVLPKYGGIVAGAGAGGAYDQRNHHNNGKHSGVSSCCIHSFYQLLTLLLLTWKILL
ncbi:uncharacterized protein LOC141699663 [Apium graveolens]|uniref:Glycine-rich protein n=1 Tax=Apium graveolens TaxID=4045 RepID=A0A6L5BFU2_APIGR|nr:hypothetical protein AG4045_021741 [Apium graveolens]